MFICFHQTVKPQYSQLNGHKQHRSVLLSTSLTKISANIMQVLQPQQLASYKPWRQPPYLTLPATWRSSTGSTDALIRSAVATGPFNLEHTFQLTTHHCSIWLRGGGEACRDPTMAAQALLSGRQLLGRPLQSSFSRSSSSRKAPFIVRAEATPPAKQGADRQLWFASKQSLSYLDGTLPGDFGFDPLGLSDPEGTGGFIEPRWLAYGEVFNGRTAMMGVVGMIAPELLGKLGLVPAETAIPWFQSGVIPPAGTYAYWADPYTLFVFELALVGFAEHRRFQDWYTPGSMSKQYFLGLEKYLGGSGEPAYPGGPLFNPLGFGTKSEAEMKELKLKEIKNGRLAMLAFLGFSVQALFTGVGPVQNLQDHLADPVHNNILTSLKFH